MATFAPCTIAEHYWKQIAKLLADLFTGYIITDTVPAIVGISHSRVINDGVECLSSLTQKMKISKVWIGSHQKVFVVWLKQTISYRWERKKNMIAFSICHLWENCSNFKRCALVVTIKIHSAVSTLNCGSVGNFLAPPHPKVESPLE